MLGSYLHFFTSLSFREKCIFEAQVSEHFPLLYLKDLEYVFYHVGRPHSRDVLFYLLSDVPVTNWAAQ